MTPYNPQEIEHQFRQLPESLKDQMMSIENSERIFAIGQMFRLTVEQIGFMAEESGYVILGLTHPKDFVSRMSEHLGIDIKKARTITQEINRQIFFPLKEMLKTAHQFEIAQELSSLISPISGSSTPSSKPVPPAFPTAPASKPAPLAAPSVPPRVPSARPLMPPAMPMSPLKPATPHGLATAQTPTLPKVLPPLTPLQPVTPTPVSPSPVLRPSYQAQSPLASLTPSAIQGKKPEPVALQSAPAIPKIAEGIKQKEQAAPPTQTPRALPQTPLAPSQIMQDKFLQEQKSKPMSEQPAIERMKESLFAPASMPAQTPSGPPSVSEQQPPPAMPPPLRVPPLEAPAKPVVLPPPRTSGDPYREPLE